MKKRAISVKSDSIQYFKYRSEARAYAMKLLEAGLTFIEIKTCLYDFEDC